MPAAAEFGVAKRVAALGTAIIHSDSKPVPYLQKRILVGAAKRLGLSSAEHEEIGKTKTALGADAELLKFEARLAANRAARHLS